MGLVPSSPNAGTLEPAPSEAIRNLEPIVPWKRLHGHGYDAVRVRHTAMLMQKEENKHSRLEVFADASRTVLAVRVIPTIRQCPFDLWLQYGQQSLLHLKLNDSENIWISGSIGTGTKIPWQVM